MNDFSFPKRERVLNRKDFVNLNRFGKRYQTAHFTLISKKNGSTISRLGITASKRIGNAVKRNKVKRLIREFFRLYKDCFPHGYDIIFVAKKGSDDLVFWKVKNEFREIILDKKIHI